MFGFLRPRQRHTRLLQADSETLDSDTLLASSSSSTLDTLKPDHPDRTNRDVRVALKTLALCSLVYVGAAVCVALSVRKTIFVVDADEFCLHHVSRYCKWAELDHTAWSLICAAPVVKEVKPNWHTQLFNGSFLHQNIFRQPAGQEVDDAWEALGVNCKSSFG